MHRTALRALLDGWLEPDRVRDVTENGLQVEGRDEIQRVLCGVTANRALLDEAVRAGVDAVFVHHGLFWGDGIRRVDGFLAARLRILLANNISLFAYHLPLDVHPTLGNNAGLADALGLDAARTAFGAWRGQAIGVAGAFPVPLSFAALRERASVAVGPALFSFGDDDRLVQRVGLCTGGAPGLLVDAAQAGLDAFVSGEVTEATQALAAECGIAFLALGHHATERFGAMRVAEALAAEGLEARFFDVPNPA